MRLRLHKLLKPARLLGDILSQIIMLFKELKEKAYYWYTNCTQNQVDDRFHWLLIANRFPNDLKFDFFKISKTIKKPSGLYTGSNIVPNVIYFWLKKPNVNNFCSLGLLLQKHSWENEMVFFQRIAQLFIVNP